LKYNWLWELDKDETYNKFAESNPSLESYETKLAYFGDIDKEIDRVGSIHVIGALSLNTKHLKKHLRDDCNNWTVRVSIRALLEFGREKLASLHRFLR
jgi:hypothetical protein